MDSYFIRLKTIQETLKELDKVTATKIEMNFNTYEKFTKYILSKSDTSKEFKTYLGIQIWQVENNQLPDNIAIIKYSDGDEKIINIFEERNQIK
jgi:L-2-hydroxyglutarate oxidase LhgO